MLSKASLDLLLLEYNPYRAPDGKYTTKQGDLYVASNGLPVPHVKSGIYHVKNQNHLELIAQAIRNEMKKGPAGKLLAKAREAGKVYLQDKHPELKASEKTFELHTKQEHEILANFYKAKMAELPPDHPGQAALKNLLQAHNAALVVHNHDTQSIHAEFGDVAAKHNVPKLLAQHTPAASQDPSKLSPETVSAASTPAAAPTVATPPTPLPEAGRKVFSDRPAAPGAG